MVVIMEAEDKSSRLCKRCHRELKDEKSKNLGYGPICYKKYLKVHKTYLFDMPTDKYEKQVNEILNNISTDELINALKENGLV